MAMIVRKTKTYDIKPQPRTQQIKFASKRKGQYNSYLIPRPCMVSATSPSKLHQAVIGTAVESLHVHTPECRLHDRQQAGQRRRGLLRLCGCE